MSALWLLLLACDGPPDAELYRLALAPGAEVDEALELCGAMREGSSECMASALRDRPLDEAERCEEIPELRWRQECHFGVAERLGQAGVRWSALHHCGLSGRYYDECLYHLWSFELQAAATPEARAGEQTRAVDRVAEARELVQFWGGIRSVAQDPVALIWDDWWYFAHLRNKPADLDACEELGDPEEARRCVRGTQRFAERYVTEAVIRPDFDDRALDRACRALGDGDLRPAAERVPANLLSGLYVPDPRMDEAALRGLRGACEEDVARPWNPVFRPVLGGRVLPGGQLPEGQAPEGVDPADVPRPADGAPPPGAPPPEPSFGPRPDRTLPEGAPPPEPSFGPRPDGAPPPTTPPPKAPQR